MTTGKSNREKALEILDKRPNEWRCYLDGKIYDKVALEKEIKAGTAVGTTAIGLLAGLTIECGGTNQLGKRYQCVVCGTEVFVTKVGKGRVECCSQLIEQEEPKQLPSSD